MVYAGRSFKRVWFRACSLAWQNSKRMTRRGRAKQIATVFPAAGKKAGNRKIVTEMFVSWDRGRPARPWTGRRRRKIGGRFLSPRAGGRDARGPRTLLREVLACIRTGARNRGRCSTQPFSLLQGKTQGTGKLCRRCLCPGTAGVPSALGQVDGEEELADGFYRCERAGETPAVPGTIPREVLACIRTGARNRGRRGTQQIPCCREKSREEWKGATPHSVASPLPAPKRARGPCRNPAPAPLNSIDTLDIMHFRM